MNKASHITNIMVVSVLSVFILLGCYPAPKKPDTIPRGDYEYTKKYISWLIEREMKKHDVKGLSIALVDDQELIWAQGFGYADVASKVPSKKETLYRVGSISKLFTATAIMQLVEDGKINIDTPIQNYLPGFSIKSRFVNSDPITPRNMMTHHSGLPSGWQKGMWNPNPEQFSEVTYKLKDEYTAFPPNHVFSYSNLAVSLLGHVLEKVTGQEFPSYMEKILLNPLGMIHSSFFLNPSNTPLLAKGYLKGKESKILPLRDLPAGGLYSNVMDLSRFMKMVFAEGRSGKKEILKPDTLKEMLKPQNDEIPLDLDFKMGLGWFLSGLNLRNAGKVAWHSGGTRLFHSQFIILPEHKLGVVVLANSSIARSVVDKIALEAMTLALETKIGTRQDEVESMEQTQTILLSKEELGEHSGYYATTMMNIIPVNVEGAQLRTTFQGRTLYLIPQSSGLFKVQYKLLGLVPISLNELKGVSISFAEISGHKILLFHHFGKKVLLGKKIPSFSYSDAWKNRIGSYELMNLDDDVPNFVNVRIRYMDELIIVNFTVPFFSDSEKSLVLKPLSDKEALIFGLGSGMGETIQIGSTNGDEGMKYSGYELGKMEMKRRDAD